MSLAKPDVIDLVTVLPGKQEVTLIAFDDGSFPDRITREQALQKKLLSYLQFVSTGQFIDAYPKFADQAVRITVVCMNPPSDEMKKISGIRDHERPESFLPVEVISDTEFRTGLRKQSTDTKQWGRIDNTCNMTETTAAQEGRTWPHWLSILVQQLIFAMLAADEIMLLHVSAWVSRVPIFIFWGMYLVAPFIYLRPVTKKKLLRLYSTAGWLFVFGAIAWGVCYWVLCEKDGVPVSWNQIEEQYMRGAR